MTVRPGEIIRDQLSWCPERQMLADRNRNKPVISISTENSSLENPGPWGTGRPEDPWNLRYEHTQQGLVIILSVLPVVLLLLASLYFIGPEPVVLFVLAVMIFLLSIMSRLTVSVSDDFIRIRFGPVGLVRKEWPVKEIVSASTVTNPWYYGCGIRWTPHGPLYNVAGRHAVEILLQSGRKVRIGTDEPDVLAGAIRNAIR